MPPTAWITGSGCSVTSIRVPPSTGRSAISTREGSPSGASHQTNRIVRGASTTSTVPSRSIAVVVGHPHLAALLRIELHLVGEPLLQVLGLRHQLPRALGLHRERQLSAYLVVLHSS